MPYLRINRSTIVLMGFICYVMRSTCRMEFKLFSGLNEASNCKNSRKHSAKKRSLDPKSMQFTFDGVGLEKNKTPKGLGMEDGDEIDALEHGALQRGTLLATGLRAYAADPDLQQEWMMVKKVNKMRLAEYIESMSGVKTKRIHKYKKAAAKYLGIIHRYDSIENYLMPSKESYHHPSTLCIPSSSSCHVRIYFTYSRSAILFKYVPTNTKLALAEDGTCTRSRCFVLRGSAPRKDPTRLAALLPPSDRLAAQRPPSRLEPA
ncbi:unnamed protein product [Prunus armeniaca]